MKKLLAFVLSAILLASALCVFAGAEESFNDGKSVYTLKSAELINFENNSVSTASAHPRGNSRLDCLIDGDAAKSVTAHNQDGIVLVCNDYIKPKYEENMTDSSLSSFMADQATEDIPTYSFVLEYSEEVTFDAVYFALFHETNACVAIPGNNAVKVEYSSNGKDWKNVGSNHYFRTVVLEEYNLNDTEHNCEVVERVVPLSKEITAKCVRLTFNFAEIPEDNQWRYYSNVYEWVGFTEIAVAKYESGAEPKVLTATEAAVPNADIEGEWIAEYDNMTIVYKFASGVYESLIYSKAEYDVDPTTDPAATDKGSYYVDGNVVTLVSEDEDIGTIILKASFGDNGELYLDDGNDKLTFVTYVAPEIGDKDEESEAESSEAEEVTSTEESEESEAKTENSSSYAPKAEDEKGLSTGALVGIIAGALVVVGAVVFIVIKKKK